MLSGLFLLDWMHWYIPLDVGGEDRESHDVVAAICYHSSSVAPAEWSGKGLPIILVHWSPVGAMVHWSLHKQPPLQLVHVAALPSAFLYSQWLSVLGYQPTLLANPHQFLFSTNSYHCRGLLGKTLLLFQSFLPACIDFEWTLIVMKGGVE